MNEMQCKECEKKFTEKEPFYQHLRDSHQLPICPVCGKQYFNEVGVKQHKKTVHNVLRPYLRKKLRKKRNKSREEEEKVDNPQD
ncbi:MAG: C2H2-type zinc finger protein [Candidatus Hodarchaeales archaeon]|jgi:NAD-dependent SIR2 family protein deacetylase